MHRSSFTSLRAREPVGYRRTRMRCSSAADAFADTHRMGIGGWLSTSDAFIWYSEVFTDEVVRQQWPQLQGSLQPYIGCFETLTQLALAQCSWQLLRSKHVRFVLPTASDNTSAESGLNKLFSTAEPLGTFLRLAATWAHLHRVQFEVEHLAGEKNVWADKLSRGNCQFLEHRSVERAHVGLAQLASASHCVALHGASVHWPPCNSRGEAFSTQRLPDAPEEGEPLGIALPIVSFRAGNASLKHCIFLAISAEKRKSVSSHCTAVFLSSVENASCELFFWSTLFST